MYPPSNMGWADFSESAEHPPFGNQASIKVSNWVVVRINSFENLGLKAVNTVTKFLLYLGGSCTISPDQVHGLSLGLSGGLPLWQSGG
uniref:Uncharacterized protein n=1 Tax=Terrapene triunguis TaxID=2587831 RepID=A0A674I020_9SAUR